MKKRRSSLSPLASFSLENLEGRVVMSGFHAAAVHQPSAMVGRANQPTKTTMAITAGSLNQPIKVTVTVRSSAAAGAPTGTVNIIDKGTVLGTATLSPTTSTNPRFAVSQATYTLPQAPGNVGYFFGRHVFNAQFVPSGGFAKSKAVDSFEVTQPSATTLSTGIKIATLSPGVGPQLKSGTTANIIYTGYLTKTGEVFDDSAAHGGKPLSFTSGGGQVIPGFDVGTAGMQVGETRMIMVPPAEGYGSTAVGSIPANSTLIFVVTLHSIS